MDTGTPNGLERLSFGDGPEMADALLALVLSGTKTATCWAARHGALSHVGKRWIACDGAGQPRVVLETVSLELRRFCDVGEAFARAEGEGDLSLAGWRAAHRAFFERDGDFSADMNLWCECFRVVRVLPAVS